MSGPTVGDLAPDFTLPGIQGEDTQDFTLSELRGHKVVLAFYPGDFTPGCTRQMCSYRDHFDDFEDADAVVWGISPQTVDRHAEWIQAKGFPFPLLADPDKGVIDAYGVSAPLIGVRLSVFVIDAAGIIRYRHVAIVGVTFRKSSDLATVLAGI